MLDVLPAYTNTSVIHAVPLTVECECMMKIEHVAIIELVEERNPTAISGILHTQPLCDDPVDDYVRDPFNNNSPLLIPIDCQDCAAYPSTLTYPGEVDWSLKRKSNVFCLMPAVYLRIYL